MPLKFPLLPFLDSGDTKQRLIHPGVDSKHGELHMFQWIWEKCLLVLFPRISANLNSTRWTVFFICWKLFPRYWAYECNTPNKHRQNIRLSGSANSMRSKMEDTFTDTQTWLDSICTKRFHPQQIETISLAWSRIRPRTWQKLRKVSDCLPFYFCLRAVLSFNLLAVVWFLQTSFVRLKPPLRGILVQLGNYPKFVRVFHGLEFKLFWEVLL